MDCNGFAIVNEAKCMSSFNADWLALKVDVYK